LKRLGIEIDAQRRIAELRIGEQQLVEIAKALSLEAKILLLDEPTASITEHETAALFTLLRKLRDDGVAIVFVSHKLEEVFAIADRVTVLRDGRNVAKGALLSEMTRQTLVSLMIGRAERVAQMGERKVDLARVALEARGLSTARGHHEITFSLHHGEILGLYGLVGAGRSELAHAILGAGRILAGELLIRGRPVRIRDVHDAATRFRIGYVSEDRKQEGLILMHSITRNVAITIWRRLANALGLINPRGETRAVAPLVERLDVRTPSLGQIVGNLSGGNQQKVSIAKWLAAKSEILIIDEPTVGIDIKTKTYLHELIGEIAREGASILLISSDMAEMITLADRILVMHGFRLVGEVANDHRYETTSKAIMGCIHAVELAPASE
jgi:ribose transport system ATP-binding protein